MTPDQHRICNHPGVCAVTVAGPWQAEAGREGPPWAAPDASWALQHEPPPSVQRRTAIDRRERGGEGEGRSERRRARVRPRDRARGESGARDRARDGTRDRTGDRESCWVAERAD